MTMLMKAGILEKISGENKFLGGLGIGSVSKSQMSKFKKILNNLTKSEKSFSDQFVRDILSKSHKIESEDIPVSNELINFQYSKAGSGEETDLETGLLEGLMQQFVRQSLETGGPIAFEVESESNGKISVKFEPRSKKLSIESEISSELVANSGFMNIFSALDIENIEFVDSKKLSGLEPASIGLNGKSIINNFLEIENKVKSSPFSFKKKNGENTSSDKLVSADKEPPLEKMRPAEKAGILKETNFSEKSVLPGQINVAGLTEKTVNAGKTEGLEGEQKSTPVAVKTPINQTEFSDTLINSIRPDSTVRPKVSQGQAVEAIKNTVAQSRSVFSGKSSGKFSATMDVAEKGVLIISSQKSNDTLETNIRVESPGAKDWLISALAKKGVKVDNISVQVNSDSSEIKNEIGGKISTFGRQVIDAEKASPAFSKVSGMIRTVLKKIAAPDNYEIPAKEKETLSANLEKFEAKISRSILNGGKVEHTVKAGSDQAVKWLEKELRPIADEIFKQELPVSKLTVVKEESVKSSLKPEVAAINLERPDIKSIGKDAKQKAALSSINLLNAEETSGDEEGFSGEPQFEKNNFQIKESSTFKEVQGAEFKIPFEGRGESSQVVNISTATGPVQFNVVNGKLVAAQKLDSSYMPEMIQKIAELAHNQANLASHKLEVQMDIQNMGKIMVDSLRRADKIHLQIQVESSEIRRVLETQLRPFIEQMAKDGIDIGKLDVSVRDEKQENRAAQNFSENAYQNREENQAPETFRDFFSNFENETEIRRDFERKQVRPKTTGNQTLEIWA